MARLKSRPSTSRFTLRRDCNSCPDTKRQVTRAVPLFWGSLWRPFGACPAVRSYPRLTPWAAFLCAASRLGAGAELCSGRQCYGASLRWTGESPVATWVVVVVAASHHLPFRKVREKERENARSLGFARDDNFLAIATIKRNTACPIRTAVSVTT